MESRVRERCLIQCHGVPSIVCRRMLEEGKVDDTDKKKDEIEEFQRERRKELSKRGEEHVPRFFKYVFSDPGYRMDINSFHI